MKKEINEKIIEVIKNELDLKEEEKDFIFNNKKILTEIYNLGYHRGRIQCFNLTFGNKQRKIKS